MSSSRLLPNGNVIMVQGHDNRVLEVTASGETIMDFQIPLPGHIYRVYKYDKNHPGLKGRISR